MIVCKIYIVLGYVVQDISKGYGVLIDVDQLKVVKEVYGVNWGLFEIFVDVKFQWEVMGECGVVVCVEWEVIFVIFLISKQNEFNCIYVGDVLNKLVSIVCVLKKQISIDQLKVVICKLLEMVLVVVNLVLFEIIGGLVDFIGLNNIKILDLGIFIFEDCKGCYIYYGICEYGMVLVMNGMVLYGGVCLYGGMFMCFIDYVCFVMCLLVLMKQLVVYVMIYDLIGLGEDGLIYQLVEYLVILCLILNIMVFCFVDIVEIVEVWEVVLILKIILLVLVLLCQGLLIVCIEYKIKNLLVQGVYVFVEVIGKCQVILIVIGFEVEVVLKVCEVLEVEGIGICVVLMLCMELFVVQDEVYCKCVLLVGFVCVVVEVGVCQGWDCWLLGECGCEVKVVFVGMDSFGVFVFVGELFEKFGIIVDNVVVQVKILLG